MFSHNLTKKSKWRLKNKDGTIYKERIEKNLGKIL